MDAFVGLALEPLSQALGKGENEGEAGVFQPRERPSGYPCPQIPASVVHPCQPPSAPGFKVTVTINHPMTWRAGYRGVN